MKASTPWLELLRRSFRRRGARARYIRSSLLLFCTLFIIDLLLLLREFSSQPCFTVPENLGKPPKVFIASTHWNNEAKLLDFWNEAVVDLTRHLGPENVYVSIYESGSWDDSKGALRRLDQDLERLEVQRTIVLGETTHIDEIAKSPAETGWIDTPRGKKELRRIPYLANLRNLSLKPMIDLALNGIKFDRVLFLNDVYFTTQDIMALLDTRKGDYAAACSMDFMHPPRYYDTFALRDSEGHEPVMSSFPYFRSRESRNAMISGQPVPVQSCWNGVVAFNAQPFYNSISPLRFRGISDSLANQHLEGSECCLVHADNPLTYGRGVWLNPQVRVGYSVDAYTSVHTPSSCWPSTTMKMRGIWQNRFRRWSTFTFHKAWVVRRRLEKWGRASVEDQHEPGFHCLINEMQVLISNGWAHV